MVERSRVNQIYPQMAAVNISAKLVAGWKIRGGPVTNNTRIGGKQLLRFGLQKVPAVAHQGVERQITLGSRSFAGRPS